MREKRLGIALIVIALVVMALPLVAGANGQETCPEDGGAPPGWVKADNLSGLTYTFDVPDGYEVTENCMKVGSHDPVFGTGNTVTNTSLFNSPQGVTCTAPGVPHTGCSLQQISHASFLLVPLTVTTVGDGSTTTVSEGTTTTVDEETTTTVADDDTTTTVDDPTTTTDPGDPDDPTTTVVITTTTDPSTPETLPFTGLGSSSLWIGGALALMAGIGLVWRSRETP